MNVRFRDEPPPRQGWITIVLIVVIATVILAATFELWMPHRLAR